ncbi:MAG: amino acid adenylation domain-containing protein [Candidatus Electrothrix sp. AU1_5]|nr:amino acid adenylation domain-containing protein [Candidatus Electrothrix gigas]
MKHIEALLDRLHQQDISLWLEEDKLRYRTPKGGLTDSLKKELKNQKTDLIAFLKNKQQEVNVAEPFPQVKPDPDAQYEPFPLSDIQQAYWIGRQGHLELGNLATQVYQEWRMPDVDIARLNESWQKVMARHPMLRTLVQSDGQQRVLAKMPDYQISVLDLREEETAQQKLENIRQDMTGHISQADEWPLFDIRVTLMPGGVHLHFCIDMLAVDTWSIELIVSDWTKFYQHPELELAPLELTFRDYMVTAKAYEESSALYKSSKEYWLNRLDRLPSAPKLPLSQEMQAIKVPKFTWFEKRLEAPLWEAVKTKAAQYELQPSALLLAVYAEALTLWSKSSHFTLNQTFFHRLPFHPQVDQVVGEFTSIMLTEIDNRSETSFIQRAKQIQTQQWQNLDHRYYSGVQVIRELNQRNNAGNAALMPVIFTNLLGVESTSHIGWGERVRLIGQTSQVYLDHIVREIDGELFLYWSAVEELFPADLLNDMFSAQLQLLKRLATEQNAWTDCHPLSLPDRQLEQRSAINDTQAPVSAALLHTLFMRQAAQTPDNVAVIGMDKTLTYQELHQQANQVGHWLKEQGAKPDQLVAVVIEKGWQQVVAVMGILMSGAAYLPIDPELPTERQHYLLAQSKVNLIVTQNTLHQQSIWPEGIKRLAVDAPDEVLDSLGDSNSATLPDLDPVQKSSDLAYVIYTSGSTGNPKGVMIDHQGAVNTILDINQRFEVTAQDRVLALSALNFDLSVYDIFGLLAVGGTIVIPAPEGRRDPSHWVTLMTEHGVTLWNTVAALMQMLVTYQAGGSSSAECATPPDLRLVMMSGDWIPLDLPDNIRQLWPKVDVMSLGGATEASIWSIYYPIANVEPAWKSIPYGKPLINQTFHVLNEYLEPCPVWTPGQLYIGGIGLALGYWEDAEKTKDSFFTHPRTGERLYKTGDLGRYLPDGNIEFLGREDFQVKIHGHRIELGEIESHLLKHPDIKNAIVAAVGDSHHDKQLAAYIVPSQSDNKAAAETQNNAAEAQPVDQASYGLQVMQGVLTDPIERLQFKLQQPGIRQFESVHPEIALPEADVDDAIYLARQSYRQFLDEPITLTKLSRLLSCLRPRSFPNALLPKYWYGSAGSLYPVQSYLYVKPDRIVDVAGGFYYYHPTKHKLVLLSSATTANQKLHGGTNQVIFEQSAFSLFLVAEYQAIDPMYGSSARDFCLLEAGYMSQLLMMEASTHDLGLCPIGGMNFEPLRAECSLTDSQEMVHSFLGGGISAEQKEQLVQAEPQNKSLEERLKDYLGQKLPRYMMPNIYVQLTELPLTANGKIDRKALPHPDVSKQTMQSVQPGNALERRLVKIVQKTINLEQVGITDNFFDLGANSLDMVQLYNAVKTEFQREITMTDIFTHATVQMLAELLGQASAIVPSPTVADTVLVSDLNPEQVDRLSANVDNLTEAEIEQLLAKL